MAVFEVWAPAASRVDIEVDGRRHPMRTVTPGPTHPEPGWWAADVEHAGHGTDYAFFLDGADLRLPDPRSAWQPFGVHAASRLVDHAAYTWHDGAWTGRPFAGSVIYELHVGTFTPEGTFHAAIERLDHLVSLGVDVVEVMPVAASPGRWGWGYDGVGLYAVQESYGGPDGFKAFVDAAHGKGLAVALDVVYNHFGPSGNYWGMFGPYMTDAHSTPWGPAINLDQAGSSAVRRFLIENALMWMRDYHVDALRLDAVHALVDSSPKHLLAELSEEVAALSARLRRPLSLVAENGNGDVRTVTPVASGGRGMTAQWADGLHHALHALLTGEQQSYYAGFGSIGALAAQLRHGFVAVEPGQGEPDEAHEIFDIVDWDGSPHAVTGDRFVVCLQNHDQVGNRARGDRISDLAAPGLVRIASALLLLSPFTPLLWMGEEWAASSPFPFFSDHPEPELAEAVRRGRTAEFVAFGWHPDDVADPQNPATRDASMLDWDELDDERHADVLAWYRRLLHLRRERPEIVDPRLDRTRVEFDEAGRWLVMYRGVGLPPGAGAGRPASGLAPADADAPATLAVVANFGRRRRRVPVQGTARHVLLESAEGVGHGPGGVTLDAQSVAVVTLS